MTLHALLPMPPVPPVPLMLMMNGGGRVDWWNGGLVDWWRVSTGE